MSKGLMDFVPFIPIIEALCNKGLKPRHELEIKDAIGTEITKETQLSYLKDNFNIKERKDILD